MSGPFIAIFLFLGFDITGCQWIWAGNHPTLGLGRPRQVETAGLERSSISEIVSSSTNSETRELRPGFRNFKTLEYIP
jgi:hypothetical protein